MLSCQTKILLVTVGLVIVLILNLVLPPEEASVPLEKWGMMCKGYFENITRCFFIRFLCKESFISTVLRLRIRQGYVWYFH